MKSIIPYKNIRFNSDITKIVVHHTQDTRIITGEDHNKEHAGINSGLGSPFDIIINPDGKIDLTPQWLYSLNYRQYVKNVHYRNVVNKNLHHFASIGRNLEERKNMVHIALIGNFDQRPPSSFQLSSLFNTLEFLARRLNLCIQNSLHYYNEFYFVSSPGIFFPEKQRIINELMLRKHLVLLCNNKPSVLFLALPATSITNTSFVANWSLTNDTADNFYLDAALDISFETFILEGIDVGNNFSFLVENLNPATAYYYRVRYEKDEEISQNSNIIGVMTLAEEIFYDVLVTAYLPE